jgi:hypothetical protein
MNSGTNQLLATFVLRQPLGKPCAVSKPWTWPEDLGQRTNDIPAVNATVIIYSFHTKGPLSRFAASSHHGWRLPRRSPLGLLDQRDEVFNGNIAFQSVGRG